MTGVVDLARHLGSLEQRMDSMEKCMLAMSTIKEEKTEVTPKFTYPFEIDYDALERATPNHLRSIKSSLYDVYVVTPYPEGEEEMPFLFTIRISRDELDMYLSALPSRFGEYIYKIVPTYEEFL